MDVVTSIPVPGIGFTNPLPPFAADHVARCCGLRQSVSQDRPAADPPARCSAAVPSTSATPVTRFVRAATALWPTTTTVGRQRQSGSRLCGKPALASRFRTAAGPYNDIGRMRFLPGMSACLLTASAAIAVAPASDAPCPDVGWSSPAAPVSRRASDSRQALSDRRRQPRRPHAQASAVNYPWLRLPRRGRRHTDHQPDRRHRGNVPEHPRRPGWLFAGGRGGGHAPGHPRWGRGRRGRVGSAAAGEVWPARSPPSRRVRQPATSSALRFPAALPPVCRQGHRPVRRRGRNLLAGAQPVRPHQLQKTSMVGRGRRLRIRTGLIPRS